MVAVPQAQMLLPRQPLLPPPLVALLAGLVSARMLPQRQHRRRPRLGQAFLAAGAAGEGAAGRRLGPPTLPKDQLLRPRR
jgi:hypothetical protein